MDTIIEQARKLGQLIATDPRAKSMRDAQSALRNSPNDQKLLEAYDAQQHRIMELEHQGKPIEPEDKRKLQSLHEQVISSRAIKDLLKAQSDYIELMTAVTTELETQALEAPA